MAKISGIYQIQSKMHPDRIYIGSAVGLYQRWWVHLCNLKANKHKNKKLQNHFNKYGEQDLQFIVLEECAKDFLIQREQYYIDTLNPWFNICKIAGSMLGFKFSDESKHIMSKIKIGKPSGRKGVKFSEDHKRNIGKAKIGCIPWSKGRNFSGEHRQHLSNAHIGIKQSNESKLKKSIALRVPVLQYDLQNNFIRKWDGAITASIELSINQSHISSCRNGGRKTAGGFIWRYESDKTVL